MSGSQNTELTVLYRTLLSGFSATWGVPDLGESTTVRVSTRLYRSLARVNPRARQIRLATAVAQASRETLAEVLCHEAAHIVAYDQHGPAIRPHGKEWTDLVCAAGYEPNVRVNAADLGIQMPTPPRRRRVRRYQYEHRCPVCQVRHIAGRVVRQWRCAACTEAGLPGELVITRSPKSPLRRRVGKGSPS